MIQRATKTRGHEDFTKTINLLLLNFVHLRGFAPSLQKFFDPYL